MEDVKMSRQRLTSVPIDKGHFVTLNKRVEGDGVVLKKGSHGVVKTIAKRVRVCTVRFFHGMEHVHLQVPFSSLKSSGGYLGTGSFVR